MIQQARVAKHEGHPLRTAQLEGLVCRKLILCVVLAALAGCASKMGAPIHAVESHPDSSPPIATPLNQGESTDLKRWDQSWSAIEASPNVVSWQVHFQVCAIKYRFRRYDELFRCLDLFDQRVARMADSEKQAAELKRYASIWTGWLRASALAELGSPEDALKWADSAWNVVPEWYRDSGRMVLKKGLTGAYLRSDPDAKAYVDFTKLCFELAGSSMYSESMQDDRFGRNNPAALDMRAQIITMNLSALRATSLAALDRPADARQALAEIQAWETFAIFWPKMALGLVPYGLHEKPYFVTAKLLSAGPLFALHDYAAVVKAYHDADAATATSKWERYLNAPTLVLEPLNPTTWVARGVNRIFDMRAFVTAVEDVSNALIYAESLARIGQVDQARSMLDTILRMPEIRDMGSLYWVALYERGQIARSDGNRALATELFKQSIEAIERTRSTIAAEAAKIGYAGNKQAAYAALVGAYADDGDWTAAFLVAERAKARALVDLLAQQRDLAPTSGETEQVRQLLASATTTDSALGLPVDTEIDRNLKEVETSRAELAGIEPEAASLVSAQNVPLAAIGQRLRTDETLLDYYRDGDQLYAFILRGARVDGVRLSATGLDQEVRAFRSAIEAQAPEAVKLGEPLYDRLIRPLGAKLGVGQLTISPHGVLHYLPFAALSDGERFLIDQYTIRLIPSASALVYLRTDRPEKPGKVLALGNPDLGDPNLDLPNAQLEALSIAAMFPASKALVRGDATKAAVKSLGGGFAILHFATHGSFNADAPMSSGLYLAGSSPADGLLTVSDLYNLRLDSEMVTLSACQTGLGKVANGDDVIGLTRGFLHAGARSIVASLWEVKDVATEQLMLSFYQNLQDHPAREALRLAQLETRQTHPHPMLWGAFQIVGSAD